MKKLTKTMMVMGVVGSMCGMGAYMYKQNSKKIKNKYKTYLEI